MSRHPRLLDLFCKAGGATKGYQEAGFYVVGVDIEPQPNYCGDRFIQFDALEFAREVPRAPVCHIAGTDELFQIGPWDIWDAIHASPPCQNRSALKARWRDRQHPELISRTRESLVQTGLPYIIENVQGAPLIEPTTLCGSSFGLGVRRHRLFETNFPLESLPCAHHLQPAPVPVYGHTGAGTNRGQERARGRRNGVSEWRQAMDITWMTADELAQAIPPAYTQFIGEQLIRHLDQRLKTTLSNIKKTRPTSTTKTKTIAART